MVNAERRYLPAAGRDWALPFYDPFNALLGMGRTRAALIDQADLRAGQRVLEIGCGTGSLVVAIKRRSPDVDVVGLDPDPKALARARRKAAGSGPIRFDRGFADELPYADGSFDRVFSAFMFHHLPAAERLTSLQEARRVLAPAGTLHLLDLAGSESDSHGWLARVLHSAEELRDNSADRVLALMRQAGFHDARKVGEGALLFGRVGLNYFRAAGEAGT